MKLIHLTLGKTVGHQGRMLSNFTIMILSTSCSTTAKDQCKPHLHGPLCSLKHIRSEPIEDSAGRYIHNAASACVSSLAFQVTHQKWLVGLLEASPEYLALVLQLNPYSRSVLLYMEKFRNSMYQEMINMISVVKNITYIFYTSREQGDEKRICAKQHQLCPSYQLFPSLPLSIDCMLLAFIREKWYLGNCFDLSVIDNHLAIKFTAFQQPWSRTVQAVFSDL